MAPVAEQHVATESENKEGVRSCRRGKGRGTLASGTSMRSLLPSLSPGWSSLYLFYETRSMEEPDDWCAVFLCPPLCRARAAH